MQQPRLLQQYRHRIYLLPGCTPRMPDTDKGISRQHRQDARPQSTVKGRITKHFGYIHRYLLHEPPEIQGIGLQPVPELRKTRKFIQGEQPVYTPLKTGPGILAEIIAILLVDVAYQ